MDNLQKIIDGLKQPIEPPKEDPKLSRGAVGQSILNRNQSKQHIFPPFSITRNRSSKEEPNTETTDPAK